MIQDPDDGTVGMMTLPSEPCTEGCGGGGTPTTMVLESIYTNVFDGIGAAELRFIVSNNAGQELGAHTFDGIHADAFRVNTVNYTLPRGPILTVREIDTWDSDPKGTYPITAIPGTVYAESVNCYWHYYDNRGHDGAEQMCGPESYREQYAWMIPHWSAKLR
ncbi:MAG: hypothetical protein ICV87_11725 [Gemmatimonadetes bacterium]|nr:hypothetical protein [Gemmatimonadota bacterium]